MHPHHCLHDAWGIEYCSGKKYQHYDNDDRGNDFFIHLIFSFVFSFIRQQFADARLRGVLGRDIARQRGGHQHDHEPNERASG